MAAQGAPSTTTAALVYEAASLGAPEGCNNGWVDGCDVGAFAVVLCDVVGRVFDIVGLDKCKGEELVAEGSVDDNFPEDSDVVYTDDGEFFVEDCGVEYFFFSVESLFGLGLSCTASTMTRITTTMAAAIPAAHSRRL
jgi:hypothetical protein